VSVFYEQIKNDDDDEMCNRAELYHSSGGLKGGGGGGHTLMAQIFFFKKPIIPCKIHTSCAFATNEDGAGKLSSAPLFKIFGSATVS